MRRSRKYTKSSRYIRKETITLDDDTFKMIKMIKMINSYGYCVEIIHYKPYITDPFLNYDKGVKMYGRQALDVIQLNTTTSLFSK